MKHITTLTLLFFAIAAKAQVAQIVSTDGGKLSNSTTSIEFTIGDVAVEPFGSGFRLFEGFQAVNYAVSLITGLQSETAFAFYPNPAQRFLTIDADISPGSTFRVTDISGKDLELSAELTAHRATIDVSSLPSSMYVLTIQDKSGIVYRVKFLKAL
jgi:hypothetical protein